MNRSVPCLLAAAALLLAGGGHGAVAAPAPAETAGQTQAAAPQTSPTVIRDPAAYVTSMYARLQKSVDFSPPDDIYTPRLAALFDEMVRDAKDEVGRVDFDFWINGQDGEIRDVKVSAMDTDQRPGDRRIVIVRFKNFGKPQELHFYFEQAGDRWLLDDVRSIDNGADAWTLSLMLKYGFDGPG